MKSSLIDALAHLFDQIQFTRKHCDPAERKVIFESIQQNGYMAHPESVILAMLGDHNRDHREKGIGIVKNIRRSEEWDKHVERESGVRRPRRIRHFKCPKIVFKCTTYFEMVRMKVEKENGPVPMKIFFQTYDNEWERVTCPPLLSVMSSAELEKIREAPLVCRIPCHSQSVEHTVALVSHAVQRRRTEDTQLMSVLQIGAARKEFSGRVTHKRYRTDTDSTPKSKKVKDTPFNRELFKDFD